MAESVSVETFAVDLPVEGPLDAATYFAPRRPMPDLPEAPRLACGTARLIQSGHDGGAAILHHAWAEGFLLTDTAPAYGEAEMIVGAALHGWSGPEPILATKCGRDRPDEASDYTPEAIHRRLERSRRRLADREVSLLAIHDATMCDPEHYGPCVACVSALRDAGVVRGIGAGGGGFDVQCQLLEHGRLDYVMTYNRLSGVTLQALRDVAPLCRERGMSLWAASPLVGGLLGDDAARFERLADAGQLCDIPLIFMTRARQVRKLAAECALPVSQLALRFLLSMPAVDVVVAGAGTSRQWADCMEAYRSGPLPVDVYERLWHIARQGLEPVAGG